MSTSVNSASASLATASVRSGSDNSCTAAHKLVRHSLRVSHSPVARGTSTHDFVGYEKKQHEWWTFEEARAWVHKLELWRFRRKGGGQRSWKEYCAKGFPNLPRRPEKFIPTHADVIYAASGWKGFQDWATW